MTILMVSVDGIGGNMLMGGLNCMENTQQLFLVLLMLIIILMYRLQLKR